MSKLSEFFLAVFLFVVDVKFLMGFIVGILAVILTRKIIKRYVGEKTKRVRLMDSSNE